MPLIFPGMDPHLENPAIFPGIHSRMIVYLADQIAPRVRPRYAASVGERVYVESSTGGLLHAIIPDVWASQTGINSDRDGSIAVATLPQVDSPIVMEAPDLEIRQPFIEILDRESNMRVVTVIELVSPAISTQAPVEIRAALEQAYDAGSYDQRIDYTKPCQPPFSPVMQTWADQLVSSSKKTTAG